MDNVEDQLVDLVFSNGNGNQDDQHNGNIVAGNQRASLDVIVEDKEDAYAIPPPKVHPTSPIQKVMVPIHMDCGRTIPSSKSCPTTSNECSNGTNQSIISLHRSRS